MEIDTVNVGLMRQAEAMQAMVILWHEKTITSSRSLQSYSCLSSGKVIGRWLM